MVPRNFFAKTLCVVGQQARLFGFCSRTCLLWLGFLIGVVSPAASTEVNVNLTVLGQGYQTQTASGELLDRRRVTPWVDLTASQLFGIQNWSARLGFRFDTDLGLSSSWDEPGSINAELLLAQLGWTHLFNRLDIVVGRQLLIDELDFLLFDGLMAEVLLPAHLSLRLASGLCVRNKSWLGGQMMDLDGVEEGQVPAPVVGANLLFQWRDLWAGLDYRRVVLWADGWPLQEERIGASVSVRIWERRIGLDGGAIFDLLQDDWERWRLDGFFWLSRLGDGIRLEAGLLHSRPRFSMDSIFNFFSPAPFDEVRAGLLWIPLVNWKNRLDFTHRNYRPANEFESAGDGAGWTVFGIDLESRLLWGAVDFASLFLAVEGGASGQRWLVHPMFSLEVVEETLQIEGRGTISYFEDPVQVNQQALSIGCSAATRWRFGESQALILIADLNGNRIHPFELRIFAVLDLDFQFGSERIP